MKKTLIALSAGVILTGLSAKLAFADTNCQSVYGGGQSCGPGNITVQKQVLRPGTTNQYVDSLGYNDAKYQPSSPIFFKITITNSTKGTLNNLVVSDLIDTQHEFINFVSAPGNFNTSTKTLSYKISSLKPNEQSTITIAGRVLDAGSLPKQAVICAGNTVQVTVNNGAPTSAITAYCIQNTSVQAPAPTSSATPVPQQTTKGGIPVNQAFQPTATPMPTQKPQQIITQPTGLPVFTGTKDITRTPKSGPEALPLLAMIPVGGMGIWLRKKSK